MLKLSLIEVPAESLDQPRVIELESPGKTKVPRVRVGRMKRECDIVLQSPYVSKRHCDLISGPDGWSIVDNDSRAGTKLNGVKISPHVPYPLHHGDNLRICGYHLLVESDESDSRTGGSSDVPIIKSQSDSGYASVIEKPGQSWSQLTATSAASKLQLLLDILRDLRHPARLEHQLRRLIDRIFMLLPNGRRATIIVKSQPTMPEGFSLVVKRAGSDLAPQHGVLDKVIKEVLEARNAVLTDDRQTMCVPLVDRDETALGCLQIESLSSSSHFTQRELELLAGAGIIVAFVVENGLHQSAVERDRKQRQDLEVARQIQRSLLPAPEDCVGDYEFFAHYEAAFQVGGDYFDFVELPQGLLAMALGDVSGKGVPASLLMVKVSSEIRLLLDMGLGPAQVLKRVNQRLAERNAGGGFVTLVLLTIDLNDNKLVLVNAGHPKPLLRLANRTVLELGFEEAQFPLGVDRDEEYREFVMDFPEEATLVLFSDGATDAERPESGQQFGVDGIKQALSNAGQAATDVGQGVIEAIQGFLGDHPNSDDLCIACLRRTHRSHSTPP